MKDMRKTRKTGVKEQSPSSIIEENKESEAEKHIDEKCHEHKTSFDDDDIKDKCSTPKEAESIENCLTCTKCSYKCKKGTSLKKHIGTKHEDNKFIECKEVLSNFTVLLKHIAENTLMMTYKITILERRLLRTQSCSKRMRNKNKKKKNIKQTMHLYLKNQCWMSFSKTLKRQKRNDKGTI